MEQKRILVAQFKHETNCFSPFPADRTAFSARNALIGAEIAPYFDGVSNEMGGFLSYFRGKEAQVRLVPVIAFNAEPSGPVTAEVYEFVTETILRALREDGPFDGVLLSLHGAMVAEGHPDGEGDLLEQIRRAAGPEVPIAASLDLHANLTEKMVRSATVLVPFLHYPHTDEFETGRRTAALLEDLLEGRAAYRMAAAYVPYLLPLYPTALPELHAFYARAAALEREQGAAMVRITHGFFPADVPYMGMAVVAVTEDGRAGELAAGLAKEIWQGRAALRRSFPPLAEALDRVETATAFPVVLADAADNPGAGGSGDTTFLLRGILARGLRGGAYAAITDPESVAACVRAGEGAEVELLLGGKGDPALTGGPLPVRARVQRITDGVYVNRDKMDHGLAIRMGTTAILEIGGNLVLVTERRTQPLDAEVFRAFGIEPERQRFLVVKSSVHYRASFGKFAAEMIEVAEGGYAPPEPERLTFRSRLCPQGEEIAE